MAQVGVLGDEIEPVGVEHAGQLACERRAEQRLGALAVAQSRADHHRLQIEPERIVRVP